MSIPAKKTELKRKLEIFSNDELTQEIRERNEKDAQEEANEKTIVQETRTFSTSIKQQQQYPQSERLINPNALQSSAIEFNPLVSNVVPLSHILLIFINLFFICCDATA